MSGETEQESVVELRGFEPLTSSMPWKRATNCAIAPSGTTGPAGRGGSTHISAPYRGSKIEAPGRAHRAQAGTVRAVICRPPAFARTMVVSLRSLSKCTVPCIV